MYSATQGASLKGSLLLIWLACVGACNPGYHSSSGYCYACPAGSFCPGDNRKYTCAPGTYTPSSGRSSCLTCLAGAYSAGGASSCTSCAAGSYNPRTGGDSASACLPCDAGKYNPSTGSNSSSACLLCASGKYNAIPGRAACADSCPLDTYSAPGSVVCWPLGAYTPVGTPNTAQCPPNTFSSQPAATNASTCAPCRAGSASDRGATSCYNTSAGCSAGSFEATANPQTCLPCAAGTFSTASGATSCAPCAAGTYSSGSATACSTCPQGSFCPGGVEAPCPLGTYGVLPGKTSQFDACAACPAGNFQPSLRATTPAACAACAAGFFSTAPASPTCTACAPGTANPLVGQSMPEACQPCAPASYTGLPGQSSCTSTCPMGYIGTTAGGTSLSTACAACSPGSYSAFAGSLRCTACPPGQYAEQPGSTYCEDCPSGSFSNTPSATSVSSCSPCIAGTYNPAPGLTSSGCIPCAPGKASFTEGASQPSQCISCSAGFYAALGGSVNCTLSPAGSYSGPSAASPTQCPLGTYSGIPGAASVAQCTSCPSGKTTASTGATQDTQCLALPYACPAGKQPRLAAAASLNDCAPLTCPLPLRPSAFPSFSSDALALAESLSCLGCASGTAGTVPACTPCGGAAFCPGFTSRPLFNFSADASTSGAARALLQGSGAPTSPFSSCPALASLTSSVAATTLASAATSTAFFGTPLPTTSTQSLLAWFVIFSLLFTLAMFVAFSRTAENATGYVALPLRALKTVDLFSMNHRVKDRTSPMNEATPLGGLFSLMGLTTLITYAAYMVATWLQDNTLVQQSLATMGPQVWGRVASLPWAEPPAVSSLGSLALRLTIDGNPGACAVPLSMTTAGLAKGAFIRQSTADCGGSGIAQHTLTCPGCQLTSDTSISLAFDYSCQSMLLEALGTSPAYPGPLALSALAASSALTAAPKPGALLTSVTWQLTPVLSVLWDNVTASNSAIGWDVADSKLTLAPFLTPPALNGSLSIIPTASSVTVTFALPLSSTYSSTLLTQRVPITQLLANIVGLSGLLAFFGMAFGLFEGYCARKRGAVEPHKPPLLRSSTGSGGDGGGSALGGSPVEANSVVAVNNPLQAASPTLPQRLTHHSECSLAGELQVLRREVEALKAAVSPREPPRAAVLLLEAPRAAVAAVVWQRHSDAGGEMWYTSSAGETAWELPPGATLEHAEGHK